MYSITLQINGQDNTIQDVTIRKTEGFQGYALYFSVAEDDPNQQALCRKVIESMEDAVVLKLGQEQLRCVNMGYSYARSTPDGSYTDFSIDLKTNGIELVIQVEPSIL